jgi:protein O-GlcNAc transferase
MTMANAFDRALELHRGGRMVEAERFYVEALAQDPRNAKAAFLSGAIALQAGRLQAAFERLTQAVALEPTNAAFQANLGEVLRRLGQFPQAMDAFMRAMALAPTLVEPTFNLGLLFFNNGELGAALACFERAAELSPGAAPIQERLEATRKALRARGEAGGTAGAGGTLRAQSGWPLVEVATTLSRQGRNEDALVLFQRAAELQPNIAELHNNVGVTLLELFRMEESAASFRRAIELNPELAEPYNNLGNVLLKCGRHEEGLAKYRKSVSLQKHSGTHSNLIFTLPFCRDYDPATILETARGFDRVYGQPLARRIAPHANTPDPERPLRLGLVSPDFREHCQSFFMAPLLQHLDRQAFEIYCYSNVFNPDRVTDAIRAVASGWRSIVELDDPAVAQCIRNDRVDILVDLTMHMERNRLVVFAHKPAPIQICWLAYPGTTGLSAMDYRITDVFLDPPGGDDSVYSERSIRLPDTFWCYHPRTNVPAVGPLPARRTGQVTFGCLNNFVKVNEEVIDLWVRVMRELPDSRMVLLAPHGDARTKLGDAMEQRGIERSRVEFVTTQPRIDYLATYQRIDIALDTLPYNGHTTSLDAWWMGVPVVTLVGNTVVGRAGLCQAMNLGLGELVAGTPEQYVEIAVGLARDLDRLSALRAGLRARIEASPLMDGARFARNFEAALRGVWRVWCAERSAGAAQK